MVAFFSLGFTRHLRQFSSPNKKARYAGAQRAKYNSNSRLRNGNEGVHYAVRIRVAADDVFRHVHTMQAAVDGAGVIHSLILVEARGADPSVYYVARVNV